VKSKRPEMHMGCNLTFIRRHFENRGAKKMMTVRIIGKWAVRMEVVPDLVKRQAM
jgi:hypothetical protein